MIFFVVSYSQCNVLAGHHCVLEIIWLVISWYLSYHLSFQKNMGVLNFFLCVYIDQELDTIIYVRSANIRLSLWHWPDTCLLLTAGDWHLTIMDLFIHRHYCGYCNVLFASRRFLWNVIQYTISGKPTAIFVQDMCA